MAKHLFQKGNKINSGREPWNKGTKGICKGNSRSFKNGEKHHNTPHSEETKKKISEILKGKWKEGKFNNRPNHSETTREKIRQTLRKLGLLRGNKSPWWNGGITTKNSKIRNSFKMKEWRRKVFKRDNYTCQECGARGCYIEAHHIRSFARYPKLRFEVSNGLTLCVRCHFIIDKYRRIFKKGE